MVMTRLVLTLILVLFTGLASAQTLNPMWLGTPEAGDYLNPRAYWQRVLAVWQGSMTPEQVALVRENIARNAPPPGASPAPAAPVPTTTTTRPGVYPGCESINPYAEPERALKCALEVVRKAPAAPTTRVYRIGHRYGDPYATHRFVVIGLTKDAAGVEVVTAQWLDTTDTFAEGDVWAFRNDESARPWFPLP
jgi:hypothetical protein